MLLTPGARRILVMVFLATALGGCTATGTPAGQDSPSAQLAPESLSLGRYQSPPNALPEASVADLPLKPSQYLWRVRGRIESTSPGSDATAVVNELPRTAWAAPTVSLKTDVPPLRARLVRYQLDTPGGLPRSDDGQAFDCEQTGQACSMELHDGTLAVRTGLTFDERTLATLTVEYATLEKADENEGIRSYVVSWVLRAAPGPND